MESRATVLGGDVQNTASRSNRGSSPAPSRPSVSRTSVDQASSVSIVATAAQAVAAARSRSRNTNEQLSLGGGSEGEAPYMILRNGRYAIAKDAREIGGSSMQNRPFDNSSHTVSGPLAYTRGLGDADDFAETNTERSDYDQSPHLSSSIPGKRKVVLTGSSDGLEKEDSLANPHPAVMYAVKKVVSSASSSRPMSAVLSERNLGETGRATRPLTAHSTRRYSQNIFKETDKNTASLTRTSFNQDLRNVDLEQLDHEFFNYDENEDEDEDEDHDIGNGDTFISRFDELFRNNVNVRDESDATLNEHEEPEALLNEADIITEIDKAGSPRFTLNDQKLSSSTSNANSKNAFIPTALFKLPLVAVDKDILQEKGYESQEFVLRPRIPMSLDACGEGHGSKPTNALSMSSTSILNQKSSYALTCPSGSATTSDVNSALRSKVALIRDMITLLKRKLAGCDLTSQRIKATISQIKRLLSRLQQDFITVARCVHDRDSAQVQSVTLNLPDESQALPPLPIAGLQGGSKDGCSQLKENLRPNTDSSSSLVSSTNSVSDLALKREGGDSKPRSQSEYIDALVDLALDAEFTELQRTSYKLERYVTYGEALISAIAEVSKSFHEQIAVAGRVLSLDIGCLSLATPSFSWKNEESKKGAPVGSQTSQSAKFIYTANNGPLLLSTTELRDLFIAEHKLKRRAALFGQHADACLEQESERCKALLRQTRVRLRAAAAHSQQQLEAIRQERSANSSRIPLLRRRRRELKRALESYLAPLELCRQRYEMRLSRGILAFEGPDGINKLLEEELSALQSKVDVLLADLEATSQDLKGVFTLDEALAAHYDTELAKVKMFVRFVRARAGTSASNTLVQRAFKQRESNKFRAKMNMLIRNPSTQDGQKDADVRRGGEIDFDEDYDSGEEEDELDVLSLRYDEGFAFGDETFLDRDADEDYDYLEDKGNTKPSASAQVHSILNYSSQKNSQRDVSVFPFNQAGQSPITNPLNSKRNHPDTRVSQRQRTSDKPSRDVLLNLHPEVALRSIGSSLVNSDEITELAIAATSIGGRTSTSGVKEPRIPVSILKSGFFKLKPNAVQNNYNSESTALNDTIPLSSVRGSGSFDAQVHTLIAHNRADARKKAAKQCRLRVQQSASRSIINAGAAQDNPIEGPSSHKKSNLASPKMALDRHSFSNASNFSENKNPPLQSTHEDVALNGTNKSARPQTAHPVSKNGALYKRQSSFIIM